MVSPLQVIETDLETKIKEYVTANRAELLEGDSKSIKTPYGSISFKWTAEKVEFESEEIVINKIKHSFKYFFDKNYRSAIKVEYRLVKEALKNINDKELESLGIRKSSEERIHIKPDLKAVKA